MGGMFVFLLPVTALRAQSDTIGSRMVHAGPIRFRTSLAVSSCCRHREMADPMEISLELASASPVILVIRSRDSVRGFGITGDHPGGFTFFRVSALNNSGLAWIEFEFELQEILGKASIFSDGLSFDQRRSASKTISSDRFAAFSRDFEPYDRLIFRDGKVDPLDTVEFSFLVTDFTPRQKFYLVLDSRIPSS
jgi:hypothetical protein